MAQDILIIDDETDIRGLIQGILEDEGYATREAANDSEAYAQVAQKCPDLIILDIWLQNSSDDGLEILKNIKADHPHVPVVMISGHGNIETAVTAIKYGAYDFIEKPFKSDRLLLLMNRALETAALRAENDTLRNKVQGSSDLVGKSQPMISLCQTLERVAATNSRVLITGEPGTGKDLAARFIHKNSSRASGPLMHLNCATLRPERLEIELFGSEEGGVLQEGLLEKADGGTLLLDEVSDMPLETQGKIVRVLQDQKFQRLGGQDMVEVDVRVIAITNRDLQAAMEEGSFRQDLFYRLSVVPIEMPPLRTRIDDIKLLAEFFCEGYAKDLGTSACTFSKAALTAMQGYEWPGNVRQLKNAVEWCMIMRPAGSEDEIALEDLPPEISNLPQKKADSDDSGHSISYQLASLPLREARETFEREYLVSQMNKFGGNISKTADFVGMERSALHRKMKQLGIQTVSKQNSNDSDESSDAVDYRESA